MAIALLVSSTAIQAESNSHVIKFDDVAWQNTGLEGVEMSILWGDEKDTSAIYAFRIQPGVTIPAHTHANDYRGIAIQGNWEHTDSEGDNVITAQESFTYIKAGDMHSDKCIGPEFCINVLDFDGFRDFVIPK